MSITSESFYEFFIAVPQTHKHILESLATSADIGNEKLGVCLLTALAKESIDAKNTAARSKEERTIAEYYNNIGKIRDFFASSSST